MKALKIIPVAASLAVISDGSTFAADLPKEGPYDFTACYSGVANPITFSKTHSAVSYEHSGATLSNPPGGMFDKGSFHCVGLSTSFDGKATNTTICETIFPDGDKILSKFSLAADGSTAREALTGTGKYEGVASAGTVVGLGSFPVIRAGTYQTCNHQTGTYKLK